MTTTELLIGLDVGTTSSKAVVFGTDGAPLSMGRAATPWRSVPTSRDSAGGTELDAMELRDAAVDALSQALTDAPAGQVVGLGVTSAAAGATSRRISRSSTEHASSARSAMSTCG